MWKTGLTNITQEMQDEWKKQMFQFLSPYGDKFVFLEMTSKEASKQLNDEYDYIYIDADHSYRHVKEDLELWYPKVRKGGVFAGHDYEKTYIIDVKTAVGEFIKKNNFDLYTSSKDGDWWIVK
jgi:predicted O-methyltransferase YrrM